MKTITNEIVKRFELYLCEEEKNSYKHKRLDAMNLNYDKVKLAYIEYRGKGRYIDEILK